MNDNLLKARDNIIESAGRATQGFGLGRIIGQLYALLFFSPRPLSLDAMAKELTVSKGSVSTNIRELEKWGAVRQVWIKGDRKDFYEAEVEFLKVLKNGILPFFINKLRSSFVALSESRAMIESKSSSQEADRRLADFCNQRLDLIDKARNQLLRLLQWPSD